MKICKKCLSKKDISNFTIDKSKKDNLTIYCKDCLKTIRENNKTKYNFNSKDYYKKINEERKDYHKSYYQENKEKIKKQYQDLKSKKL